MSEVEIIKVHDPLDSMTTAELARHARRKMYEDLQLARRKREVDGTGWKNLNDRFYVVLFLESDGIRLETIDELPHGVPQIIVKGRTRELALAHMHTAWGRALHERGIVTDELEAMKIAGEAEFVIVSA